MKLRSAAKAVIRRKTDGKYLILTSSVWEKNPARSQKPDLPGGLIEAGESIETGLLRELEEEIGIKFDEKQLQLVWGNAYVEDDISTTFLLYYIELENDPKITLSWEHERYEWMSAEEVLKLKIRDPYPEIFSHFAQVGLLD